ncbi:unnamed protein product [Lactuca virosa]|uniref:Uncharacterized protein n=1 Tax=Lactuca virosa TaxID=75947 RepID=A0AAU9NZ07_9ASTR|nr:unnamed protein product [Lactuca virosa]
MENQSELIIELRSKLSSSENRVKELEAAHAKLASLVSSCICHKTHKGAACVRDKPFMHCNKHCTIFSKDKASGNQAIDLGEEDVAEETKKTSPIDVEGFGNVPMSQGPTASVTSKRKRNKSVEVGSFYLKASKDINEKLEKFGDKLNETINNIGSRENKEACDMSDKVLEEMRYLQNVNIKHCLKAIDIISRDQLRAHLFFQLNEEGKECYIEMIGDGLIA